MSDWDFLTWHLNSIRIARPFGGVAVRIRFKCFVTVVARQSSVVPTTDDGRPETDDRNEAFEFDSNCEASKGSCCSNQIQMPSWADFVLEAKVRVDRFDLRVDSIENLAMGRAGPPWRSKWVRTARKT